MDERKIDIKFGEWFQRGFALFKDNAVTLIVATLLVLVIGGATGGILGAPMFAGLIVMALALADKKQPQPDIGVVFRGFDFFLNTFLFGLVWCLVVSIGVGLLGLMPRVGLLLGTLGVIVLTTMLMFALFLIVDRKMEFWPASMESVNRVKANFFPLFGFMLLLSLIAIIGAAFTCGIGLLVTTPFAVCCLAVAYRDTFGPAPA